MNPPTTDILPQGYKITELGPLPEEWKIINLDEIIDLKRGISWRKDEANKEGIGIPVIGIPNIKENGKIDFIDTYFLTKDIPGDKMLRINDILFVGSSGSLKNIGRNVLIREIQKNKFTYASFTFLGRVDPLKANTEYIFYLLNSPIVDYNKYARRASDGKYNFQLTQFKNEQKIPLPPLSEQQKIAAVLTAVQEAKEKTQAVIDATKVLKKSMMKHLFTYGPVPPEETENVPLKETEIGKVPEDWEVVKLNNKYIEFISGLWEGKNEPLIKANVIRNVNFNNNGTINYSNIAQLKIEEKQLKKRILQNGDIILERSGGGPTQPVGRVVYFEKQDEKLYSFSNFTTRIRVIDKNKFYPKYLFYFLFYFYSQGKTYDLQNRTTGIRNLDFSKYKEIGIPLPPLPVQQKIASILSAIDAKIEAEENKKQALEDLFKTLLHNLMTAKIRVTAIHDLP